MKVRFDKSEMKQLAFNSGQLSKLYFHKTVLSVITHSTWIFAIVLFIVWPKKEDLYYVTHQEIPVAFLVLFELALCYCVYFNTVQGRREYHAYQRFLVRGEELADPMIAPHQTNRLDSFHHFGLILILLLPILPFLTLGALLAGMAPVIYVKSLLILLISSILSRSIGIFFFNWLGIFSRIGFLGTRLFIISFLITNWIYCPAFCPSYLIYQYYQGRNPMTESWTYFSLFLIISTVCSALLMASSSMIRFVKSKELSHHDN